MIDYQQQIAALENVLHRTGQRRVLFLVLVSTIANVVLGTGLLYSVIYTPLPKFFKTSINNQVEALDSLPEPNQSDYAILQWASLAAVATYSYNFVHYREELEATSAFFTTEGWASYLTALENSRNLSAVTSKQLLVSAVITSAPVILAKGPLYGGSGGPWAWRVQMPILVNYRSSSVSEQENNIVTMLIVRMSTLKNPRGIGIDQFVVSPAGTGEMPGAGVLL